MTDRLKEWLIELPKDHERNKPNFIDFRNTVGISHGRDTHGVPIVLSRRRLKRLLGCRLSFYLCSSKLTWSEVYLSICQFWHVNHSQASLALCSHSDSTTILFPGFSIRSLDNIECRWTWHARLWHNGMFSGFRMIDRYTREQVWREDDR